MPRVYLKVPFQQKDAAKSLGAKWDASLSKWYVPEGLDTSAFSTWLTGALAVASLPSSAETSRTTLSSMNGAVETTKNAVPLSRLLAGVASAVAAAYRSGVWTTVEVTEVRARAGHVYLDLSERDLNGNLLAKTTGTIWADSANRILPEFERATGVTLAPGIKLLVRARPVYKAQYGLSVDIDAIDPAFTLGDLEARKREIRSRLQAEGIFEAQQVLPAPWDFNSVLVVAPDGAAGLGDFKAESERLARFGVCEFVYVSSRFQGEGAAAEIVEVLREALQKWFRDRESTPDAVVIIRGGGAVNDLAWLNDYALGKFICELDVPVFTGIGHERDSTIVDEVAHTKFDTPSKVIAAIEQVMVRRTREAAEAYRSVIQTTELATGRMRAAVQRLDGDVRAGAMRQVERARRASSEQLGVVKEVSRQTVYLARGLAMEHIESVRRGALKSLGLARTNASSSRNFVLERAGSSLFRARDSLDASFLAVAQGARWRVADARSRSESLMREIAGQGPDKTLVRGFAVVRTAEGKPVTRVNDVTAGQAVTMQFSDGSVGAKVQQEKP